MCCLLVYVPFMALHFAIKCLPVYINGTIFPQCT